MRSSSLSKLHGMDSTVQSHGRAILLPRRIRLALSPLGPHHPQRIALPRSLQDGEDLDVIVELACLDAVPCDGARVCIAAVGRPGEMKVVGDHVTPLVLADVEPSLHDLESRSRWKPASQCSRKADTTGARKTHHSF